MSNLSKALDSYQDFSHNGYFTHIYDTLASELSLEVPLETTKINLDEVLVLMDLSEYELVLKCWNTEDASDADFSKDFPFELLYKSINRKGTIWISLRRDTLSVDFFYDCKDLELEKSLVDMNDKLRKRFGLSRTPTFKVLTKCSSGFNTENVRTEAIEIDVHKNYNNSFLEVHEKISTSISNKNSGLILLYGTPGTGKTTYIKHLILKHPKANFIFIQNEFVRNLLDPDFISFLLKQRNSILVIEDAEKVITSRESQREESVVSTILQLTDGLFSDYLNIKVICTFNTNLSKIDTALLRKGRMLAMYEFNSLSLEKTNKLLEDIGSENSTEGLSVADIYNIKEENYNNIKKKKIGF